MKNLSLFAILIILIGVVYYFEELGGEKELQEELQKKQLFDSKKLGSLMGIKTNSFYIKRDKRNFVIASNSRRVDQFKLDKVLEVLGSLKTKRVLTNKEIEKLERKSIFPDDKRELSFILEKGMVTFLLGSKLPLDQSFYLEVRQGENKRVVIAYDDSLEEGMYDPNINFRSNKKYQRLQSLLFLPDKFFYDLKIFDTGRKWKYVKVSNNRNRSLGIDFLKKTTDPSPPKGLNYLSYYFQDAHEKILNIQALDIKESFDFEKLGEPIGVLFLQDQDGQNEELKLYGSYEGKNGNFVTKKGDPSLYALGKEAGLFFLGAHEFWDKRLVIDSKEVIFSLLGKAGEKWKLKKSDREVFEVNSLDSSQTLAPSNIQFKKLFNFLNKQADYITDWDQLDQELMKDRLFSLSFPKGDIDVIFKARELLIINQKLGHKLHYKINGELPFPLKAKDYFLSL